MKTAVSFVAVLALAAILCASAAAGDRTLFGSKEKYDRAEETLLIGLRSDNAGLRESSAYMLGELRSTRAVIPLMRMLRTDTRECGRTVAALALCRIGDARGTYAVKLATTFDAVPAVQQRCAWFYSKYVDEKAFAFVEEPPAGLDVAVK
jgi:hypothetical protein